MSSLPDGAEFPVQPVARERLLRELALGALGLLVLSLVIRVHWMADFAIFFILVLSFDLLYGYMGHLSFGHMLYFGVGAYGAALWLVYGTASAGAALAVGLAAAAATAAILGGVVLRTRGASFALINMAFNEIGHFLVQSPLAAYTLGEDGLSCTADPLFGAISLYEDRWAFACSGAVLLAVYALLRLLTRSPFGLLVRSIRENETRVRFLGYDTFRFKWITFVIASTIAALAGGLFTLVQGFVSPRVISPFGNVDVIFAVLIGGAGSLVGALIGAAAFLAIKNFLPVIIPEISRLLQVKLPQWELWLGVVLLAIVFSLRGGIVGTVQARLRLRKPAGEP